MKPEPKFVPGEIVAIASSRMYPGLVGQQFTVIAANWSDRWIGEPSASWGYKLDDGLPDEINGMSCAWAEDQLRKLPPDTPAAFDAAIWQPRKVTA